MLFNRPANEVMLWPWCGVLFFRWASDGTVRLCCRQVPRGRRCLQASGKIQEIHFLRLKEVILLNFVAINDSFPTDNRLDHGSVPGGLLWKRWAGWETAEACTDALQTAEDLWRSGKPSSKYIYENKDCSCNGPDIKTMLVSLTFS